VETTVDVWSSNDIHFDEVGGFSIVIEFIFEKAFQFYFETVGFLNKIRPKLIREIVFLI